MPQASRPAEIRGRNEAAGMKFFSGGVVSRENKPRGKKGVGSGSGVCSENDSRPLFFPHWLQHRPYSLLSMFYQAT